MASSTYQAPTPRPNEPQGQRGQVEWRRLTHWARSFASSSLCFGLTLCYIARPDACAAVTVFPLWAWLGPGLVLVAFNLRGRGKRKGWLVIAAWLIFLLLLAEEPWSLGRALVRLGPFRHGARAPGTS